MSDEDAEAKEIKRLAELLLDNAEEQYELARQVRAASIPRSSGEVSEPTEAMIKAGRAAWQSAIKDRNLDQWLGRIFTAMREAQLKGGG